MNQISKEAIGIPELVSIIVSEFSFMQCLKKCDMLIEKGQMTKPEVSLQEVHDDAFLFIIQRYKIKMNDELDMIIEVEADFLTDLISALLVPYRSDYDVIAMQQNIHNKINQLP